VYKKLNFEPKKRQTEIANFRYHLWAGEIIYSISYLNDLQNICFICISMRPKYHISNTYSVFNVIFIFNSRCIERYCLLIAHSSSTHHPQYDDFPSVCQLIGCGAIFPLENRYAVSTLWATPCNHIQGNEFYYDQHSIYKAI
jgi:hypothetical protein